MSSRNLSRPQDLGPERLKTAEGTPILDASVEAEGRASDLCTGRVPRGAARARILAWLAEGAREVTWALCTLPGERWALVPPACLDEWPALRHVRHLALREMHQTLPRVRHALGDDPSDAPLRSTLEIEQADAAWDSASALESAEALLRDFGETRFELLRRLEAAPDEAWQRPLAAVASESSGGVHPVQLDWLLLSARQHELQHLAAIWRIALNWDRGARPAVPGVPLHPADRLEESH